MRSDECLQGSRKARQEHRRVVVKRDVLDLEPQGSLGVLQEDLLLVGGEALLAHLDDHELAVRQLDRLAEREDADHGAIAHEFGIDFDPALVGADLNANFLAMKNGSLDMSGAKASYLAALMAAKDALLAGKHVLVEKPISAPVDAADPIVAPPPAPDSLCRAA